MSDTKPFIFIEPLSDTLLKLKEVVQETAAEEGIEIFTIEDMMEANQLVPSVGQSLIVCSNPKKCAAILQANRKMIAKLGSKVILLSPKNIPRKTLEKFMKVGLTECVVEPVPPKTLLYKVKLLLRSISTRKEEGDMEMRSIKSDEEATVSSNDKQRLEKGIISDESAEDLYQREKKTSEEVQADYELNAKTEKAADEIDRHWSGKLSKSEKKEDEKKKNSESTSVDHLEGHYKGKISTASEEYEEEDEPKKKKAVEIDLDYDDFKTGTEEELDFDLDDLKKKKQDKKDNEKEAKDLTSDGQKEKIETHYKGKLSGLQIDEEEYGELTSGTDLDLDFDPAPKKEAPLSIEDEDEEDESKKTASLDLEFDDAKKKKAQPEEIDEEEESTRQKSVELDLSEDKDRGPKLEKEQKEKKGPHTGDVDHIETLLKGHLDHTKSESDDKEDYQDRNEDAALEFEDARNKEKDSLDEDDEDFYEKEKIDLKFTDAPDYKKEKPEESEEEDFYDRNLEKLKMLEKAKERDRAAAAQKDDEDEKDRKKSVELDLDDDSGRKRNSHQEEEDDLLRTRKVEAQNAAPERERSPIDAHSEHIQTYYKSGEGIKHTDDNWDNKYDRPQREAEEDKGPQEDKILQMLAKEDRGEQTIDYKRLKEQFDAISMGADGKLKMADVIITDSGSGSKIKGPRYYREDITQEDDQKTEEEIAEEEKLKNQIFLPVAAGLDFVIRMSEFYNIKDRTEEEFFATVSEHIWEKFQAHCCFFIRRPEKSEYEIVHQKLLEDLPEESPALEFSMENAMQARFDTWALMSLPYWLDHTFQTDKQVFFFPYTEGAQKIGFATVHFFNKIEESQTSEIEVILESVRGIYLQAFHKTGLEGNYSQEKKEEPKKEKLLSKLMFWKKAG